MAIHPTALAFLFVLTPLALSSQDADRATQETYEIVYRPKAGDVWQRSLRGQHTLGLDSLTRKVGDKPSESIQVRTLLTSDNSMTYVDEIRAAEGSRALEFRRRFLTVGVVATQNHLQEGAELNKVQLGGAIAGLSLVFTWVEKEQDYGRYYDGREFRESWLLDLPAGLECLSLLPGRPVAVGDSWSCKPEVLREMLAPAGDPHYQTRKGVDRVLTRTLQMGVGGSFSHVLRGKGSGEVQVQLAKVEDLGGRQVARLSVEVKDVRFLGDITEFSQDNRLKREADAGIDSTKGKLLFELSGRGTLTWDLEAGRMLEFQFTGQEAYRTDIKVTGLEAVYTERAQLSGRLDLTSTSVPYRGSAEGASPGR